MLNFEIYTNKIKWDEALKDFDEYDMYHTYDYHEISRNNGEGIPLLMTVKSKTNKNLMYWPVLKRKINNTELFDLTSVYGYSGPILTDYSRAEECFDFLFRSLQSMGFVSMFARMHPLFINKLSNSELYGIKLNSKLIVIDTVQQHIPIKYYRANHRRDINKAQDIGMKTIVDESCKDIEKFTDIYHQAMRDLGANEYYFFNKDHISNLISSNEFETVFIYSQLDDIITGAAMFTITKNIMHYYIGGIVKEFRKLSPLKLILSRAHEFAINKDIPNFILGGGAGGENDPLLRFKRGFSKLEFPLYIFKKIINEDAYEEICISREIDPQRDDYFPAYRRPTNAGGPMNEGID